MTKKQDNHDTWVDDVAGKDIVFDGGIRVVEESKAEKRKHWLRHRVTFFAFTGIVLALIGWYSAGVFLTRVSIGSARVSARQSDELLKATIADQASKYRLTIVYPSGPAKTYSLSDMGLGVNASETIKQMRRAERDISRRIQWWQTTRVLLVLQSDHAKRNNFIAKNATVTIQPATSATLSIKDGDVVMSAGATGKHYGLHDPVGTLHYAAASMRSEPLKLQTLSTRPAITSKQLAPYQTKLKGMLNQSVALTIGTKVFRATTADVSQWIEITPNNDGKKMDITVNSGLVVDYINKIAAPFVRPSKSQLEFTRDDGTTAVLVKGSGGTDVADKDMVATGVAKALLDNKPVNETLRLDHSDFKTVSANAYDKWIEVDITTKQMYLYEQSTVVKSYPISAGAPATPTVTGQYAIFAKVEQQDMRGLNVDGSSYFQPNVAWVNYFYKDYAIHGNYWRPLSWFGRINSSHGCVSLPNTEAQWVYNWAPKGTPVIVHT